MKIVKRLWNFLKFDLRVFVWYLFTEPFYEFGNILRRQAKEIRKPKKIIAYSTAAFIAGVIANNQPIMVYSFAAMTTAFIVGEYQSGYWRRKYRNTLEKKIGKEYRVNKTQNKESGK